MRGKQIIAAAIAGVTLLGAGFWFGQVAASTNEPGSANDPLVSKSYVDQLVAGLADKSYVDQLVAALPDMADLEARLANLPDMAEVQSHLANVPDKEYVDSRLTFQVVNVPKGSSLIGEGGTEIVLRGGKATAIASPLGGLFDATAGMDVFNGAAVQPNHLLVVPRSDGRGLAATQDMILLVKGPYTVR